MKNNFQLIVFDWDGTLVDSISWIVSCLQYTAQQCSYAIPEDAAARDVIGLSIQGAVRQLFPGIDADGEADFIRCYSERFFSRQHGPEDLFAGVSDMLQQLQQRGVQLAVATGKSRAGLNKALAATQIGHLFAATRCADETASKPEPLMLHEIMRQLDVAPQRTLMVGDSVHDLQMAANAQVAAAGVACGAHAKPVLQQYRPLYCLNNTHELLAFL